MFLKNTGTNTFRAFTNNAIAGKVKGLSENLTITIVDDRARRLIIDPIFAERRALADTYGINDDKSPKAPEEIEIAHHNRCVELLRAGEASGLITIEREAEISFEEALAAISSLASQPSLDDSDTENPF